MTKENTCPVCEANPIDSPHEVCETCYNKVKSYYVHPRKHFERGQEKHRQNWLKDGKILKPEVIEHNIKFGMKSEAEQWARIVGNGLSAVVVMIEAIDDQEPTPAFHRRRIAFMYDLINRLDPALFAPASKVEVESFMKSAIAFWNDEIAEDERQSIHKAFSELMPDKTPCDWSAKSIVHWMISLQSHFDWMWFQWFESVYDAIPNELSYAVWMELFKKHFSDSIEEWALSAD